jgi:3-oxoacyl-[acyl-carrier-protein] synthase-3
MAEAGRSALEQAGMRASQISWWIPHQANARVIEDTGARLGIEPERTINIVPLYGNSSAATIPTAMTDAVANGKLRAGDTVLLTAAGAGLVTAGAVVRWS